MKILTKRVEKCKFYKTKFLNKDNQRNSSFVFSSIQTWPLFTCKKNTFLSKTLQKLRETKLSKEEVFVFFLINKTYKSILMKNEPKNYEIYEKSTYKKTKRKLP